MKMWSLRTPGISTKSNELTLADGKKIFIHVQFDSPTFLSVLLGGHIFFKSWIKIIEVRIQRRKPVRMINDDIPPKTLWPYSHMRNETGSSSIYGLIHFLIGPDVKSHMPVIIPKLSEIGGKFHWEIKRISEISLGIGMRLPMQVSGNKEIEQAGKTTLKGHMQN